MGYFSRSAGCLNMALELAAGSPGLLARCHEFFASLLESTREFTTAMAHLRVAEVVRASLGKKDDLARCLVQQGIVLGYLGDLPGAVSVLRRAIPLAEKADTLRFVIQPLAWNLVEAGALEEAEQVLSEGRSLFAEGPGLFRRKVKWLDGKIASARNQRQLAAEIYRTVRDEYVGDGMMQEAAFVSVDLARCELACSNLRGAHVAIEQAVPILAALGIRLDYHAARLIQTRVGGLIDQTARLVSTLSDKISEASARRRSKGL